MPSPFDLDGRVIVVTGGLGQLGRQFASRWSRHGGRAVVLDVRAPEDRTLGGRHSHGAYGPRAARRAT